MRTQRRGEFSWKRLARSRGEYHSWYGCCRGYNFDGKLPEKNGVKVSRSSGSLTPKKWGHGVARFTLLDGQLGCLWSWLGLPGRILEPQIERFVVVLGCAIWTAMWDHVNSLVTDPIQIVGYRPLLWLLIPIKCNLLALAGQYKPSVRVCSKAWVVRRADFIPAESFRSWGTKKCLTVGSKRGRELSKQTCTGKIWVRQISVSPVVLGGK